MKKGSQHVDQQQEEDSPRHSGRSQYNYTDKSQLLFIQSEIVNLDNCFQLLGKLTFIGW